MAQALSGPLNWLNTLKHTEKKNVLCVYENVYENMENAHIISG